MKNQMGGGLLSIHVSPTYTQYLFSLIVLTDHVAFLNSGVMHTIVKYSNIALPLRALPPLNLVPS